MGPWFLHDFFWRCRIDVGEKKEEAGPLQDDQLLNFGYLATEPGSANEKNNGRGRETQSQMSKFKISH
jgi:hypothetical protein